MDERKDHLWKVAQEAEERIEDLMKAGSNPVGASPAPQADGDPVSLLAAVCASYERGEPSSPILTAGASRT